jgi:hypothetical protein
MAVRNTPPSSTFEEWRQETNEIATDAGDVSTLSTTATNLTGAVNEHEGDITTNTAAIATKEQVGVAVAMAIALGG